MWNINLLATGLWAASYQFSVLCLHVCFVCKYVCTCVCMCALCVHMCVHASKMGDIGRQPEDEGRQALRELLHH